MFREPQRHYTFTKGTIPFAAHEIVLERSQVPFSYPSQALLLPIVKHFPDIRWVMKKSGKDLVHLVDTVEQEKPHSSVVHRIIFRK